MPDQWAALFAANPSVLQSHRGWDPGTAELADELSEALAVPLLAGKVTRLLVDLNRSVGHPDHFSEFSRDLPADQRALLIERYWQPHWAAFRQHVEQSSALVHIACHSFTPELNGQRRNADIGLLYDPARSGEREFAQALRRALQQRLPDLRVRMNYPYLGKSNGLGQQHRRLFAEDRLLSLELEINARLVFQPDWPATRRDVVQACCLALHAG